MSNPLVITGHLVYWNLYSGEITRDKFYATLDNCGFKGCPRNESHARSISIALSTVRNKLRKKKIEIVLIRQAKKLRHYAIMQNVIDRKRIDITSKNVTTFALDMRTGALTCDWPDESFEVIKKVYDDVQVYASPKDMFEALAFCIHRMRGIALRKKGSIYFVPRVFSKQLKRLASAIHTMSKRSHIYLVPQINDECTNVAIQHAIGLHISPQLLTIKNHNQFRRRYRKLMVNDMRRVQELRRMLELYHDLVDYPLEPMLTSIMRLAKGMNLIFDASNR